MIYKNKSLQGIISQYTSVDQNLSFLISNNDYFSSSLEANSFNVEFIESFFSEDYVFFNDLKISGNAEIKGESFEEVNYLDFDLTLNGNIEYLTFSGNKKIKFTDNLLTGSFDNNKADISSNFFVRQSSLKVGFKKTW